ncbi:MAG: hypothetical protein WD733_22475 [Bryobacterales bacterium]
MLSRPRTILAIAVGLILLAPGCGQPTTVREASGVARQGDYLLIVDDEQNGVYFRHRLEPEERGPLIRIEPRQLEPVALPLSNLATDLESIDVLADGRVAVISERLRSLFGPDGVIAEYDAPYAEFGKRGLEGVAVLALPRQVSRVAALWEGGYPEFDFVPRQLRERVGRIALRPLLLVHDLAPGLREIAIRAGKDVELETPLPTGEEPSAQRFRAPDLVWHRAPDGNWGFIVILSSLNSMGERAYLHHWLQRFSAGGKRIGEPLDIDKFAPAELKGANWEGLAWFEDGNSLILVHESTPQDASAVTAIVLPLPEDWKFSRADLPLVTESEADYFLESPRQPRADGTVPAGTKVTLMRNEGSYYFVRTEAALEAYVLASNLAPFRAP